MICPACGKEMESGWVYSRGVMMWSPEQGKMPRISGPEDVSLMKEMPWGFAPDYPIGYICKDCRKVIIEY
ncbi:MAG: hypothetical protein HDT15_08360 [Oscillibacter sp.]|nr:hypothetical protein [Oscillibacter sp.]MBD5169880.1 hypothetical protein [Oscillibacter sp.]